MLQLKSNDNFSVMQYEKKDTMYIKVNADVQDTYIELSYQVNMRITGNEYVLFPSCCYKGNQFSVMKKNYPPMFTEEEADVNIENIITDVPRLKKDGKGKIEITTGDVSVPCVAVYSNEEKKAAFLYTIQEIDGINLGLSYENGQIGITYPHMRKNSIYRWPFMRKEEDRGRAFNKGSKIEIPYKIFEFPCRDIQEFFQFFFTNRKCMGLPSDRPETLPFDKQVKIQIEKFNKMNWRAEGGFYGVGTVEEPGQMWQLGWVGGGAASYALMKLGGALEWKRGICTLEHIFKTQLESGFFMDECDSSGNPASNPTSASEKWHLIRRSADTLYFLFKHFGLMKERNVKIPEPFLEGTKKLADAFVKMWDAYGQFGQFINRNTGCIVVGKSTAGALVPGALASAYQFFSDERYLRVSRESADMYWDNFVMEGFTTGGTGEVLQCPDSESAFALLESYVVLYEVIQEEKWLEYAKHMVNFCSSWVVSYNYKFPKNCEFERKDMKTVGAVFANVQNKHAAPGICTLSGDSLFKVYKWTKNPMYLELAKDVTLTISQYMSTDKRPIYSWDVPKDAALLDDDSVKAEPEKLPQGYICERVNMSDWESERCIGGVFNGSCWPETGNLLVLAEVIGEMKLETP